MWVTREELGEGYTGRKSLAIGSATKVRCLTCFCHQLLHDVLRRAGKRRVLCCVRAVVCVPNEASW
jgi:hypothetical protein